MLVTDNLKEITVVSMYQAPANAKVVPFEIPDHTELIELLTGGRIYWEEDGSHTPYERGTVFWHLPGEHTIWHTTPEAPYNCLSIRIQTYRPPERKVPRISQWDKEEELQRFVNDALRYFHDDATDRSVFYPSLYMKLFWQAYCYAQRKPAPGLPPFLQQLLAQTGRQLDRNLSVEAMAELCGMSVPYLHAQFKKHLGVGPHEYVLNRRLQKAKNLLAGNVVTIKEICVQCGFENLESFYRAFRRHAGVTPGEYRTKYRPYHNLKDLL